MAESISFKLNDKPVQVDVDGERPLLWVLRTDLGLTGRQPLNTSGGHLSESYMQGWGLFTESVRQIRGECGARQLKKADNILYTCASPIPSGAIFSRDAA